MIRLYDYWESGNAYKVRLLLSQLGIPFELVPVDIQKNETRTAEFLRKNPNHRVPVVEWPDGRILAESNAILFYFAQATPFLSDDPWQQAQTLQWMFFEQYSHEPNIAVVRFWAFSGQTENNRTALPAKMDAGYHALGVMDGHLAAHEYFAGDRYSIADIALYAYTHAAGEGGFDVDRFPAVEAWLARIKQQPGHVLITDDVGVAGVS